MALPSIELCLCPPSPPRLPSVSALLQETCGTVYHNENQQLHFPSPLRHSQLQKQQDFLLLPPPLFSRSRSHSTASSASSVSSSMPSPTTTHYSLSDEIIPKTTTETEPSVSSSSSSSSSPTANHTGKRKRGRPPNAIRHQGDSWTFVTPTVWEVKPIAEHPMTVLLWPEQQQQDSRRASSTHTFTSTKMDTALSMPKKKRGRKPKVQLEGNSCFVWRDLAAKKATRR